MFSYYAFLTIFNFTIKDLCLKFADELTVPKKKRVYGNADISA